MTVINVYAVVDKNTCEVIGKRMEHSYPTKFNGLTLTYQDVRTLKLTYHEVFLSTAKKYVDQLDKLEDPYFWCVDNTTTIFDDPNAIKTDYFLTSMGKLPQSERLAIFLD